MSKKDLNQADKNSKITKLLEDIDLNLIQDIEVDEHIESLIDMEKIKNKALQHAKDTLEEEKEEASPVINMKEKRVKKRGFRRSILIPLVAILGLIGAAIASTGLNTTLNNLFGELFPYEDQVQVVGIKQVKSGIVYTVEGAFIDNKSGLFIVSMMKEDGSKFEQDDFIRSMRLDMDKPGGQGWGTQTYLEDDDKKLVTVMDLSSSRNLYNQKITLSAENIMRWVEDEEELEIDLEEMYQNQKFEVLRGNEETWYEYEREDGLDLHLVQSIEDFSIDDIRLTDKGLSILTSYEEPEMAIEGTSVWLNLVDTRTGNVYEGEPYTNWDGENRLTKNAFVFKDITRDDLPYLQVKYSAQYETMVIEGKWEVTLKLNKNSQVVSKRILQRTKVMEDTLLLTHIDVSALGVTLKGYGETDNLVHLDVEVIMKDGEEKRVTYSGSSNDMAGMTCYYDLGKMSESYIPEFIHLEDVVGVRIGDKVIKINSKN